MRRIPGAVGSVAFGSFHALDFTTRPGAYIPPIPTRTGRVSATGAVDVAFNLWLPSGTPPPRGCILVPATTMAADRDWPSRVGRVPRNEERECRICRRADRIGGACRGPAPGTAGPRRSDVGEFLSRGAPDEIHTAWWATGLGLLAVGPHLRDPLPQCCECHALGSWIRCLLKAASMWTDNETAPNRCRAGSSDTCRGRRPRFW